MENDILPRYIRQLALDKDNNSATSQNKKEKQTSLGGTTLDECGCLIKPAAGCSCCRGGGGGGGRLASLIYANLSSEASKE